MTHELVPRAVSSLARSMVADFRVTVMQGPRQVGKTTLMNALHRELGGSQYTLDREDTLGAALADPSGFSMAGAEPRFIDEIQRAGDPLVRAIKARVDDDPRPGRYVLAGSTRFLTTPGLIESLAGRAVGVEVWPLSMSEISGGGASMLDAAFTNPDSLRAAVPEAAARGDYLEMLCAGGFPEPRRLSGRSRSAWYKNYVDAVIQRDLREMGRLREPSAASQVLRSLAALTAQELVITNIADRTGLKRDTVSRYVGLLEAVFLVHQLPSWSNNLTTRIVKHRKVHLVDSGLTAHLLGTTADKLARPGAPELGALLETFVFTEIAKQASWSETEVTLSHFRDRAGLEVDLIVEDAAGRYVGIEVKASSTPRFDDGKHLAYLRDKTGDRFLHGIVLHLGDQVLPFGERITALPVSALWSPST